MSELAGWSLVVALLIGGIVLVRTRLAALPGRDGPRRGRADGGATPEADGPAAEAVALDDVVRSAYCGPFVHAGEMVEVAIFRHRGQQDWRLEIRDGVNPPVLWSERFPSETAAWQRFLETVETEGMERLAGPRQRRVR